MPLPTFQELMDAEVSTGGGPPVPEGFYNAVITGAEVRGGLKGPYIAFETTIHGDGDDDEYRGRKVWRNSSFSEKARHMPGGISEVFQATKPDVDMDTPREELPAVLAAAVLHSPVVIEVEHEQKQNREGVDQFNMDGSPALRGVVSSFTAPQDDFIGTIKAEAAGLDDDLPF